MDAWEQLWRTAARQDRMFTTLQAAVCGIPPRTLQRRARREAWYQPHPGVWNAPGSPATHRGALRAAVLAAGGDAALTGVSTLWLVEAISGRPDRVDLWVPPRQGTRPSGIVRVTRGALLDDDDIERIAGFPSLSVIRAVTDLAAVASLSQLARVIAALDRLRLATHGGIRAYVERRGRFPGVVKLRVALAWVEDDLNHSASEARGRHLLRDAGLDPSPAPYGIRVDGVPVAEVDIAFPRWRYGIEVDGPHHLLPEVARADRARHRMLRTHGWWIDRFTTDDVDDTPQAFVTAVRRGLEAARARP